MERRRRDVSFSLILSPQRNNFLTLVVNQQLPEASEKRTGIKVQRDLLNRPRGQEIKTYRSERWYTVRMGAIHC